MSSDWRHCLQSNYVDLFCNLDTTNGLQGSMRKRLVLDASIIRGIWELPIESDRVKAILKHLLEGDYSRFLSFCRALEDCGQKHIVTEYLTTPRPCQSDVTDATAVQHEEPLSDFHQQQLNENWNCLGQRIESDSSFVQLLENKEVFTKTQVKRLKDIERDSKRNEEILRLLEKTSEEKFQKFLECLRETSQSVALELLSDEPVQASRSNSSTRTLPPFDYQKQQADEFGSDTLPPNDFAELRKQFERGGSARCADYIRRNLDAWKSLPLKIGVAGQSGSGKSSFINQMNNLTPGSEGAAPVGITETTRESKSYPHPNNPNLIFHDLPGVGTATYSKANYLDTIKVDTFDFFLLLTTNRFYNNDKWLHEEFEKRNKGHYLVRTSVDLDVDKELKAHPIIHVDAEEIRRQKEERKRRTLKAIRADARHNFPNLPRIFLVDNYNRADFDFPSLEASLVQDFPQHKKTALIFSLTSFNKELMNRKVKELRSRMINISLLSGAAALVPMPGISIAVDHLVILRELMFYERQLGLDEKSLRRLADNVRIRFEILSAFSDKYGITLTVEGLRSMILATPVVAANVLEEFSRYIPFVGLPVAAALSCATTYHLLNSMLNKMEKAALAILHEASVHNM